MVRINQADIKEKYACLAKKYDFLVCPMEFFLTARLRKRLLRKARGKVLEVGIGTGNNIKHYPENCSITGIDYTAGMLKIARKKAKMLGRKVDLQVMDSQNLKFAKNKFDTIVDTLCLCTYPKPIEALKEMKRVCRKNGRILMLEHGISNNWFVRKLQKWRERKHCERLGCNLKRNPEELVHKAGL